MLLKKEDIMAQLKDADQNQAERFATYVVTLQGEKKKNDTTQVWEDKNPWAVKYTLDFVAEKFRRVALDELVFDWVHVTFQSTGISYDYIAYKKKMYTAYPESVFDAQIVYKGDKFSFKKESGKVYYSHEFANPFEKVDKDIIGAYAVVKNRRWEFIVTLTPADIEKHRKVAKTDAIWKAWFAEMVMKTIAKKICKQFFADDYQGIEELDNENYDLENLNVTDTEVWRTEIPAITTLSDLIAYYNTNKGKWKEFDALLVERKNELIAERQKKEAEKEEKDKEPTLPTVTPPTNDNPQ